MIEVATPRIFDLNQRLFNYAINNIAVPRINKILTMYSVIQPSTKHGSGQSNKEIVYLRPLNDAAIVKYLKDHPVKYPDDRKIYNMIFDENFYDFKAHRKLKC